MSAAVLYVLDLERMRDFYETCFEMVARRPAHEGAYVLEAQTWELTLVRVPGSIADTLVIATPPQPRENAAIKLVFDVPDLDRARATVVAAGGYIDSEKAAWSFEGQCHLDVCDPEGNVTQLRQRVPPSGATARNLR